MWSAACCLECGAEGRHCRRAHARSPVPRGVDARRVRAEQRTRAWLRPSLAQSTATHLLHPHVRVRAEAVLTHDGEVAALPAISFRVAKEAMRHSSDCLGKGLAVRGHGGTARLETPSASRGATQYEFVSGACCGHSLRLGSVPPCQITAMLTHFTAARLRSALPWRPLLSHRWRRCCGATLLSG